VALIERDVTLRKHVEHELREAGRHKDEFLAMLGHELRNPLVPIRNAAEVLRRVAGDDQRLAWVHDILVRQVGHVTRLVDDLLDISLITRGTMQLRVEPVDLCFALGRAIETAQPLIERQRHRFERHLPARPVWVEGDPIRLAQVFENLLTNAAKYTDDGGEIAVSLQTDKQTAVVRVRDNGLGIAPAMQGRIFDLFVQDQRSVDRSQGGLGIGLALVRHLVSLHGGTIEARSDGVGKGSEFTVRLRLLPAAKVRRAAQKGSDTVGGTGRVMIVDDDREGGSSLDVLLRLYGYEVEHAVDLNAALQLARRLRPQVVLMDVAMPDADGYEVARRLRAMPEMAAGASFIAVSGFGQPDDFRRSAAAGFARHLVKPVDPAELDAVIKRELAAARAAG